MGKISVEARDDKSLFRITTWPSEPLPLPQSTYWLPRACFDEDYEVFVVEVPGLGPVHDGHYGRVLEELIVESTAGDEYPERFQQVGGWGEHYLELCRLDLDDVGAIVNFVERFGYLGVRFEGGLGPLLSHRQGFMRALWQSDTRPAEETDLERERLLDEALAEVEGRLFARAVFDHDSRETEDIVVVESIEDFRLGAWQLRDLVRAWRIVSGEVEPEEILDEWETPGLWPEDPEDRDIVSTNPLHAPHISYLFTWAMSAVPLGALAPFSPRLPFAYERDVFGGAYAIPLYNMLALELFNHVVEGLPYRTCANTTCGRLFVRQRGRSVHGQHRTRGVKYCSVECARNQAQRAYRRRKRSAAAS